MPAGFEETICSDSVAFGSIVPEVEQDNHELQKQHYENIIPQQSGISSFSASHSIEYIPV